MKKILLIVVFITGACEIKAQQLFQAKPADSLLNSFRTRPDNSFQLFQPNVNLNQSLSNALVSISSIDHMPVIALNGNSKMPAAKIGGYYKMPVKKFSSGSLFQGDWNLRPGSPVFKTP